VSVRLRRLALGGAAVGWSLLLAGASLRPEPPAVEPVPGAVAAAVRSEPLPVAAVQADVALADKWVDAKIDSTKRPYAALTAAAARDGAGFVVWAETAVPAYLRYDPELLAWTRGVVREAGVPLYTGFPDAERTPEGVLTRYNASGLFDAAGRLQERYAKHHLLPIGEAMPFTRHLPFLAKLDVGQAEWTPGPPPQPLRLATPQGDFPFNGLICFESAFARLARHAVVAGSRCLVVITNDGWFGESAGPRQHTALARIRAAECGVPLIRCANNGISLIADRRGRVLDSLDLGRRGFVAAAIAPGPADTVFVRSGYAPLFRALLVWLVLVALLRPRGGR
jgi:apolipoprotein N-acyltransferase